MNSVLNIEFEVLMGHIEINVLTVIWLYGADTEEEGGLWRKRHIY